MAGGFVDAEASALSMPVAVDRRASCVASALSGVALVCASSTALAFETPTQECVNAMADKAPFQQLRSRAPLRFSEQNFSTLTIATKAGADDQPGIRQWAEAIEWCHSELAESTKTLPPAAVQILERDHTQFLVLLADLYSGNITFGDFGKRRAELNSITTGQIMGLADERRRAREQAAQQQAQQQAQEAAQANQAARNAAIGILMGRAFAPAPAYVPMQPYQIPIRPSVTTNCSQIGNQWNCTSR